MTALSERFKNAWHAFNGRDSTSSFQNEGYPVGYVGSYYPRRSYSIYNDKSIVMTIYTQIAVDCAAININHVRLNEEGTYEETIKDSLNRALTLEANIDQTGKELIRDIVISMLDEGVVALVPTVTDVNPNRTDSYKVYEIRTAKILAWFPRQVQVELLNDQTGQRQTLMVEKRYTPIIENPFYPIMNEPNSTLQQLKRVLAQINDTNDLASSGKLDLIIQLPYPVKNPIKKEQAEARRKNIEDQLNGAQHGIVYIDGTEKVIQLNRAVENNLWEQRNDLIKQLFSEMGMSPAIFDGTADEETLLNYYNRTIEPIVSAITDNIERKWISRTAQAQGQAIRYYQDPFKLIPVSKLAEIVDKFTRNAVMSSNEFRSVIGMKRVDDPKADMLINHNLNQPEEVEQKAKEENSNENSKSE